MSLLRSLKQIFARISIDMTLLTELQTGAFISRDMTLPTQLQTGSFISMDMTLLTELETGALVDKPETRKIKNRINCRGENSELAQPARTASANLRPRHPRSCAVPTAIVDREPDQTTTEKIVPPFSLRRKSEAHPPTRHRLKRNTLHRETR